MPYILATPKCPTLVFVTDWRCIATEFLVAWPNTTSEWHSEEDRTSFTLKTTGDLHAVLSERHDTLPQQMRECPNADFFLIPWHREIDLLHLRHDEVEVHDKHLSDRDRHSVGTSGPSRARLEKTYGRLPESIEGDHESNKRKLQLKIEDCKLEKENEDAERLMQFGERLYKVKDRAWVRRLLGKRREGTKGDYRVLLWALLAEDWAWIKADAGNKGDPWVQSDDSVSSYRNITDEKEEELRTWVEGMEAQGFGY